MRRLLGFVLLLVLIAGAWLFFTRYEIIGLDQVSIRPREGQRAFSLPGFGDLAGSITTQEAPQAAPPVERHGDTIRIASFNIQVLGQSKIGKPQVMQVLADVIRRFDVVAIQEVRSKRQDVLPRLVEKVNSQGRHYDFVISEPMGRTNSKEQYAYIYDAQSLEVDRSSLYAVNDPDDLLHRPPFVAGFRVRGPPIEQAFTFTLINIHTDPDETDQELDALDDVYRRVRDDGRGEDDIILLGDLNVNDRNLGQLGRVQGIRWLIAGVPTNTRGTKLYDNILLDARSTTEYLGVAGVFDILREYNLTTERALSVSDHLPIWGEFSVREGGPSGRVATKPKAQQR